MQHVLFTAGHSVLPVHEFIHLLESYGIKCVADIRRYPVSRRYPWFSASPLKDSLSKSGISYTHIEALGGKREPASVTSGKKSGKPAFQGYIDYTTTDEFRKGISALSDLCSTGNTVIMCAEGDWKKCHRSVVSDYLKERNWKIIHIKPSTNATDHVFSKALQQRKLF